NLALAAFPNGSGTDLYAGAINIFKCRITSGSPNCSTWLNVTHVYGCNPIGAISHVHPDQHAFDFLVANPNVMFFANDGGLYRALNSKTGLNVGSCGAGSNAFDNLNTRMGSMAQFVWLSNDISDPKTLLGGTQDNGSPAMDGSSLSGTYGFDWISVNNGDGGYNEINPNNPNEWFTTNIGFPILRCGNGIACTSDSFQPVINATDVSNDDSLFYVPYMLDPRASAEIVVGTCRVWRGPSSGNWTPPNALSNNFNSGDGSTCSNNDQMVQALAAGGPATANGSQVVYAGTEDGRLFVTSDADGGASTWNQSTKSSSGLDTTGFPISSIALDPSDDSGSTAYLTVMGFGVPHVWRTSNAGGTWVDVSGIDTGKLPDAPADSVVVDPENPNNVYVGTDVGVFMTEDAGTTWTEVGLQDGVGSLPSVAVTRLAVLTTPSVKKLRAATYGRGVWEIDLPDGITPDFRFSATTATRSVLAGQETAFSGTLIPRNGFSSPVTLSCTGAAVPASCTISPQTITLAGTAQSFTATVRDTRAAQYSFNVKGVAATGTTHVLPLVLQVVDFQLGASPASATVRSGQTATYTVALTPQGGSFNAEINFGCSGLPAGASCVFTPASVSPGSSPGAVRMDVTTVPLLAGVQPRPLSPHAPRLALLMVAPAVALGVVSIAGRKSRKRAWWSMLMLVLVVAMGLVACGGGGNGGNFASSRSNTAPGTYQITVTASSGSLQHNTSVTLVVQ
ncbi:MAG TPA: hypothetical protein VGM03_18525, partial [Phycisphaerae bacterium]